MQEYDGVEVPDFAANLPGMAHFAGSQTRPLAKCWHRRSKAEVHGQLRQVWINEERSVDRADSKQTEGHWFLAACHAGQDISLPYWE